MKGQIDLFVDNPEYEAFLKKFEPKKTTDDCYTPPEIYDVIRDWACAEYGIDPKKIVRPFYPGGDYERYEYGFDDVVLDNPPFSILSKICEFYLDNGIQFFLFAPSLTALNGKRISERINHIFCDADITYENGAVVRTAFVTSYGDEIARTAPDLMKKIKKVQDEKKKGIVLPKYEYPNNILTAAMMQKYAKYGIEYKVKRTDAVSIGSMDMQRQCGKSIFGGGLLLSERAAAERKHIVEWQLSEREKAIVSRLGREATP